ncbi:MAG TPA: ABC transporter permease [Bryobacteraceae bacterium]|jgi:predicted permease|nr:ABC transporter permease [Bryobacteraceae bacterium]
MRRLKCFLKRMKALATTQRDEERLRTEIDEYLSLQTAENQRAGLSPEEARRQAVLKFGSVEAIKESYREQRGLPFIQTLIQDTRLALRRMRMAPAFSIATVATLALGIGATTSIFTLAHAVILKSLPVAKPEELYRVGRESRCCYWGASWTQKDEFSLVSYELYNHLRNNTKGFAELAAFSATEFLFGVRRNGSPEPAQSYPGEAVSGNYFSMFGIRSWAGRTLRPDDDRAGAPPVAMMSYRLWEQKYASDPSVVGSVFNLSDKPYTVVGITPPGFYGDQLRDPPPDFYVPLHSSDPSDLATPNLFWLDLIGRARPGASASAIEAEMRVKLKQWLRSHWGDMGPNDRTLLPQQTLYLGPGGAGITGMRDQYEHWLRILLAVAGFALLIVCANVANLMLVRGMERRRQTSLCIALGARAQRVVRQALTESVLLSLLGGAAGLALAFAGARLILYLAFPPRPGVAAVPISASPSLPVLAFAFAISLVTGSVFGIGPAWLATRIDPIEALRGANRSTARTGSLPRKTLVVIQAALALALLCVSGLLTTTLRRLENEDFGFVQERRLVVLADPRLAGYQADQLTPLYSRIHESLAALPAIRAVALCVYSPMGSNNWSTVVRVDGRAPAGPGDEERDAASWERVTGGYFDVIGEPIVRGRGINEDDTAAARHVAIINEAFAHRFFPNQDPIGRRFGQYGPPFLNQYEIVGVAKDARYFPNGMDKPVGPFFFLPETQHDYFPAPQHGELSESSHFLRNIVIELKPGARPPIAQIRQVVASIEPNMPILSIRSLQEQVAGQFTQQRLIARLTSFFGALSLVLASIGLYGVIAYSAGRRRGEIGVRMAVGAGRPDVVALLLRGALTLIGLGLLIGLPLALAGGRLLGNQLYGVSSYDPMVLSIAAAVLAASAFVASLIPALRASWISPMDALRAE